MADFNPVSCEVCLRPYPLSNLFMVPIGSDIEGKGRLASICLSCATEIAAALKAARPDTKKEKIDAP